MLEDVVLSGADRFACERSVESKDPYQFNVTDWSIAGIFSARVGSEMCSGQRSFDYETASRSDEFPSTG